MRHTAIKESKMPNQCYLCEKEANHFVKLKGGEELHCCNEHYNRWMCERLGYDYDQYVPPKTISVLEQRYKVAMEVVSFGVVYYAYRGRKGVEESWAVQVPFTIKRKEALDFLKEKVAIHQVMASDDESFLDMAGAIGVGAFDEVWGEDPYFIYKGQKLSVEDLVDLLSFHQEYNLVYHLEPRMPNPDGRWVTYEEDVIPDEDADDHW
jgi:hypothetical protein